MASTLRGQILITSPNTINLKPRILQLVDSFDEGGSERQALQLTRLLKNSGRYEVFLASLKPNGVLRVDAESLGFDDTPSYPLNSFYDRNTFNQLSRFVRHLRDSKIDLVHTHDFYTNIFGMAAALLAGVKLRIASRRETEGMRTVWQSRLQQLAYAVADVVVANSESVRRKLIAEGVSKQKITVVYNGIDLKRVTPVTSSSRVERLKALGGFKFSPSYIVTIVANMRHDVKDHPMFLRAARQVCEAVPDTGFILVGEGGLRSELEGLAQSLGIGDKTFFAGRSGNVAEVLEVSDVCVLSSKAEGFSNSILEYMAAGKPVVATEVGGAAEAIAEAETGYLVPSGDDQLMAHRIVSLLLSPDLAGEMGRKGRAVVEEKFSTDAQLSNTEKLYERLLASKRPVASKDAEETSQTEPIVVR